MIGQTITEMAPAKVNLNLQIQGRRDDGYHLLDSAVIFTAFGDQISLTAANSDSLSIIGDFAPALEDNISDSPIASNLCLRALAGFREAGGIIAPLEITLDKRIPVGAGLGGGSADAAAMLRALNTHADKSITAEILHMLAASLGADVPACLHARTLRMRGIGDQITPLAMPDADHAKAILLANPLIPLATKDVFDNFSNAAQSHNLDTPDDFGTHGFLALARRGNDLTDTAIRLVPEIATLLTLLQQQSGCQIAAMSGSGASCFALFETNAACQHAEAVLQTAGIWAKATHII